MSSAPLDTLRLAAENLRQKPARTAALAAVAFILGFALFAGAVLVSGLQTGLAAMSRRFGADLMVVPAKQADKARAILLRGEPGFFYFDGGVIRDIEALEGVQAASAQYFLTSLTAECCDAPVQLIAFDPDTDFAVRPWIGQALGGGGGIAEGKMVVGSRVDVRTNGTILLFNREYPVAARLSPTSSGFDTSIFMTRGTMDILKANIHEAGYRLLQDGEPASSVSAILVRLRSGANAQVVASQIRRLDAEVDVIVSESILSAVSEALGGFTAYIKAVIAVVLALAVVVLAACFGGSVNERKREFAVLRLLGATRGRLASLVLAESSITALAGGAAGVALAALAVFPFSTAIGAALALPYASLGAGLIAALVAGSLALSFAAGAAAAAFSAFRIGSAETYFTMRADG